MPVSEINKLKGVSQHFGYSNISNILETNLKFHYDWHLLKIGGWIDVLVGGGAFRPGDPSQLRMVNDLNHPAGTVWQGRRKDWVWETDVDYIDVNGDEQNPVTVGTPVVNGVSTAIPYKVNYQEGTIIFDSPITPNSVVQVQHAYRSVQTYVGSKCAWWQEFQYHSMKTDNNQFLKFDQGNWSINSHKRVQMPSVVIKVVPRGTAGGYELGSHSLDVNREIMFHILTEDDNMMNNLMDIFNLQTDKSIWLFNINKIIEDNQYPLDSNGDLVNSNVYPDFIEEEYRYIKTRMENSRISNIEQIHPNLFESVVQTTFSSIL